MSNITLVRYVTRRNVRAFLWALRYGEGTQGEEGYRTLFGGKLFLGADGVYGTFDDYSDHPRIRTTLRLKKGGVLTSTAAGAYQFLSRTWDGVAKQYGLENFEPPTQDLAAIALIAGRRALDDVVAGRIEQAVMKCNKEWASLPGSPYGQPVVTMDEFKREYEEAGGLYVDEDAIIDVTARTITPEARIMRAATPPPLPEPKLPPVEDRVPVPVEIIRQRESEPPTIQAQESAMPSPALLALAPVIIPKLVELVPQLARIFSSGSKTAERNVVALETVVNVAKEAIGAKNEQELIEAIEADPSQSVAVKQAIERNYLQIEEAGGGGIEGARKFAIEAANVRGPDGALIPLTKQPAFVISAFMMSLVALMSVAVMFPWELLRESQEPIYTVEMRLIVVTALIGAMSTVGAFWLGSNFASRQKDQTISNLGQRATDRM